MVERMHRQLKASLMATMTSNNWIDHLPLVLLGMRTALKEDIGSSSAEVVYGTTLSLPGQYFISTNDDLNHSDFTKKLKSSMNELRPQRPKHHLAKEKLFYIPEALEKCSHVFIRNDTVRSPLQQPYDGPFPVLHRNEKFFEIDINGRIDNVSIDRLKPAFIVDHSSLHSPVSPSSEISSQATSQTTSSSNPSYADIVRRNLTTTRYGRTSNPVQRFGV